MFLMGSVRGDMNKEYYPLYLTEINGKTILEQQIEYAREIESCNLIFALKELDIKLFRSDSVIRQLEPNARIVSIKGQTQGAICTAVLGVKFIDNNEELLLMAIDDFMEDSGVEIINKFRKQGADAGVVSFNSVHPRYSFVKTNAVGEPIEFAEKNPISKNALVSFYYFKRGCDFVENAKEVIRKDNPVNGNFYISQTLNEMILKQKKIIAHAIANDRFHPLKTEAQLAEYICEYKEKKVSK
jgi:hypothetical protein